MASKKKGKVGKPPMTQEYIDQEHEALKEWLKKPSNVFIKQFEADRKYYKGKVNVLADKCEKYARTLKEAQAKQEAWMWKQGFHGKNSAFVKWALCTLHNYKLDPDEVNRLETELEELKKVVGTKDYSDEPSEE